MQQRFLLEILMLAQHVSGTTVPIIRSSRVLYRVFQKELYNETTITGIVYLDMLQEFLIPQLDEDDQEGRIHFQQDGALPHYHGEVREYLNTRFPGRWIGRAAPISMATSFPGFFLMGIR